MFDCANILKNILLEDKDQDQSKDKYQNQTKNNQNEESKNVHQDLPKKWRIIKDHPIQNIIWIFLRKSQFDTPLTKYVTLWLLFPKSLRQK